MVTVLASMRYYYGHHMYCYQIPNPVVILPVVDIDQLQRSATLDSVIGTRLFGELGLVLHQDWCGYSFHVYPSDELYGLYTTNTPLLVALFCAGVFLFTALMVR